MTPQEYETEYNNRAKVADSAARIAGWARDAAAFRAAWPHAETDLAYGDRPREKLDLFWPGSGRAAPLALFIHGGYWQSLDKSYASHCAAGLLAHGVAVAVAGYDLCPVVTLETIVGQLRQAVLFLATRLQRPVLAIGHSAGGHLAAMLLATDWQAQGCAAALVPAALPISGLFDLAPLLHTSLNTALGLDATRAAALSPMLLPPPPGRLHAVVGGAEGQEYTRQSREIAASWDGSWDTVPDANHFTVLDSLSDPEGGLTKAALALL